MASHLSPMETQIYLLAKSGKTYSEIRFLLKINHCTLHTHAHHIKRKTGVSLQSVIRYAKGIPEPQKKIVRIDLKSDGPTFSQLQAMHLLAQGKSYAQIGHTLQIAPQSAQNAISTGCQRAGITAAGHKRTQRIREYLACGDRPPVTMDDPMFLP